MAQEKNIVSKALNKADDIFNSLKKAYTDRVTKSDNGLAKSISVTSPDMQTGASLTKVSPSEGRNEYSADFYTSALNKVPEKKYSASTPLGDIEAGVIDGSLRAKYTSPWEKYNDEGMLLEGFSKLGDIQRTSSQKGIETYPTDNSYMNLSKVTTPDNMVDYSAMLRTALNLPNMDVAVQSPLGALSFGAQGKIADDDTSVAYADLIPSRTTQEIYNSLVNAIAKQKFLNSQGTQL